MSVCTRTHTHQKKEKRKQASTDVELGNLLFKKHRLSGQPFSMAKNTKMIWKPIFYSLSAHTIEVLRWDTEYSFLPYSFI